MSVILETTKGDLTVDLYIKARPKTCLNFLKLCKIKSYNLNRFHYVERNFLCQTGDKTGTGRGGGSIYGILYGDQARYYEAEQVPVLKHTKPGLLSMVNVGENMLGSQFFITLGDNLDYLDKEHCVFGEVVEGHDALLNINDAICDEKHIPYQDIRITHTVILDDPFPDPVGLRIPCESPEPTRDMVETGRIGADEEINEMEGMAAEEIEELIADREAKARATILEMVGDLPDADVAPPENVLFVCKLNPVTTDDDLMIIFSRFGKIVCCEIIRDRLTGNSLQYAFIEFDNPKSCEDAYFKMDNVLIDDRRIHVDFSQSVSRIQWKGKGRGINFVGGKSFDPNKEDYKMKSGQGKPPPAREDRFQKPEQQRDYKPRGPPNRPPHHDGERNRDNRRSPDRGSRRQQQDWNREPDRRRDRNEHNQRRDDHPRRNYEDNRRRDDSSRRHNDDGQRRDDSYRRNHEIDRRREDQPRRNYEEDRRQQPRSEERKRNDPPREASSNHRDDTPSKKVKKRSSSAASSSSANSSSDDERSRKSSKKNKKSKKRLVQAHYP
uniref:Peptidyl-prolyl cis-trans isomerase n=1 Tax=Eubosmina coregoni TaxID=186181 RepID=A0A4Y7LLA4_9CRUS|nr:EOG090X0971 [Eubosmina coregoni]SVE69908.1 EOG090X0971 [Eubosmina coregoni]